MPKQAHVSGKLMAKMAPTWFDRFALIEEYTATMNNLGEEVQTYGTVFGMDAIPCRLAPVITPQEQRTAALTPTEQTHTAILKGDWPTITTKMRATIDGVVYDIITALVDSQRTMTHLGLRQIAS